jgi:hypothetical protein
MKTAHPVTNDDVKHFGLAFGGDGLHEKAVIAALECIRDLFFAGNRSDENKGYGFFSKPCRFVDNGFEFHSVHSGHVQVGNDEKYSITGADEMPERFSRIGKIFHLHFSLSCP